jgi:hypothetical protein
MVQQIGVCGADLGRDVLQGDGIGSAFQKNAPCDTQGFGLCLLCGTAFANGMIRRGRPLAVRGHQFPSSSAVEQQYIKAENSYAVSTPPGLPAHDPGHPEETGTTRLYRIPAPRVLCQH